MTFRPNPGDPALDGNVVTPVTVHNVGTDPIPVTLTNESGDPTDVNLESASPNLVLSVEVTGTAPGGDPTDVLVLNDDSQGIPVRNVAGGVSLFTAPNPVGGGLVYVTETGLTNGSSSPTLAPAIIGRRSVLLNGVYSANGPGRLAVRQNVPSQPDETIFAIIFPTGGGTFSLGPIYATIVDRSLSVRWEPDSGSESATADVSVQGAYV
jgi:hypothetical protein